MTVINSCITCDVNDCLEVFVPDERIPHGTLSRLASEDGWTSIGRNGHWNNYCPVHDPDKENE